MLKPALVQTIRLIAAVSIFTFSFSACTKKVENDTEGSEQEPDGGKKREVVKEVKLVSPLKKTTAVTIRESVNLDPMERGAVSADVDSTILKWHVEENQFVKAGQLVATMDATNFAIQLEQAKAGIAALEIQYAGVGADYKRIKDLEAKGAASKAQLDSLETQYNSLEQQIDSNKKSISLMARMLGKTKVRAPFAGVITHKKLAIGGKTVTMMPDGAQLAFIERIDRLKAEVWLSELYYGEVNASDPISFEIPSLNKTVTSTIESKGISINESRKFNIIVYLDNKDFSIPAGISAIAVVNTKERERIIVPPTAVIEKGDRVAEVYSVEKGKVVAHQVMTGFPFEEGIEVMGEIPKAVINDASLVKAGETVSAK
jgi:RND family efflux transporter MFP subunit